jgi:hypothetical protein
MPVNTHFNPDTYARSVDKRNRSLNSVETKFRAVPTDGKATDSDCTKGTLQLRRAEDLNVAYASGYISQACERRTTSPRNRLRCRSRWREWKDLSISEFSSDCGAERPLRNIIP